MNWEDIRNLIGGAGSTGYQQDQLNPQTQGLIAAAASLTPEEEEEEEDEQHVAPPQAGIVPMYKRMQRGDDGSFGETPQGMMRIPGTGHALNQAGIGGALMALSAGLR